MSKEIEIEQPNTVSNKKEKLKIEFRPPKYNS